MQRSLILLVLLSAHGVLGCGKNSDSSDVKENVTQSIANGASSPQSGAGAQSPAATCQTTAEINAWRTHKIDDADQNKHFCITALPSGVKIAHMDNSYSTFFTWSEALSICGSLTLLGEKWKVPAISKPASEIYVTDNIELDLGRSADFINKYIQVQLGIPDGDGFWTSSRVMNTLNGAVLLPTYVYNVSVGDDPEFNVYYVDTSKADGKDRVLCVGG